ncbi:MAG: DUF433 domain-containing protein [Chloroflexi bacterium]|nr:DUF433 domain-containing protein [Chloroflexota bacterium]MCL5274588.1 DUF433 domain-containing protein [Chloroflexota bacterium]
MATVAVVEKYIDISPEIRFGKPCISGTRIAVVDIANWHNKLGMPLEQIAGDYDLPLPAVYAAMAYYFEHRAEIDARQENSQASADNILAEQPPSKLQAILKARQEKGN